MQELIKIEKQLIGSEEVNSVNARDLHMELGIKKQFSEWMSHQVNSLGLEMNIDYITNIENSNGGRPQKSYTLTLDTAKHIAMASRTAKGKQVRAYFIAVEKEFKAVMNGGGVSSDVSAIIGMFQQSMALQQQHNEMMMTSMNSMMQMMGAVVETTNAIITQNSAVMEYIKKTEEAKTLSPKQRKALYEHIKEELNVVADAHGVRQNIYHTSAFVLLKREFGVDHYADIRSKDFESACHTISKFAMQEMGYDDLTFSAEH